MVSKGIKISLSIALMVFVLTITPASTFFQPAMAATLTGIAVLPSNNIVNTRTTYDIIFQTATTGTIKTIQMDFPSSFDVSAATRVIEKADIGPGSLSALSSSTLLYTVNDAVSVSAGTKIRLEIGKIINSDTADSFFKVSITTKDTAGGTIDGPTLSPSIPIKDISSSDIAANTITGDDISPSFMIRKTILDNPAGNAQGWNPNNVNQFLTVSDPDVVGTPENIFVVPSVQGRACSAFVDPNEPGTFDVICNNAILDFTSLEYLIIKLPNSGFVDASDTSSLSSIPSSPFDSLQADK